MDKKGMFLWALLGCLLLAGCQKETESQQDVQGNILVGVTE